ncbi:MAG: hypothetical protein SGJ19_20395 [Planctomycetia bacterium]|nr:hypothetical protein [Planctomycetia bacterium]
MIDTFREIWLADFEFSAPTGERPEPLCLVAREFRTGRLLRLWRADLQSLRLPPFETGKGTLFVAYYASAELGCFLSLGWPMPARILDLFVEFRNATNGLPTECGSGLLGALVHFGLDGIASAEKQEMRELAMRGGDYTDAEQAALLDYCQTDVDALTKLLTAMLPEIDLPQATLRGRYMAAGARMESIGVPIDLETLEQLRESWRLIQGKLIERIDADFGVYVPRGQKRLDHRSDPRGRFENGNAGGPGRPKKAPPPREINPSLVVQPIELMLLRDALLLRDEMMQHIRKDCPPHIVARLEHLLRETDRLAGLNPDEQRPPR